MLKKNTSDTDILINQHAIVYLAKIEAKKLLKSLKNTDKSNFDNKYKNLTLMVCQNQIAKEKGYLDWYHLYHTVKKEVESQILPNMLENIFSKALHNKLHKIVISFTDNIASISFLRQNEGNPSIFKNYNTEDSFHLLKLLSDFQINSYQKNSIIYDKKEYSIFQHGFPFVAWCQDFYNINATSYIIHSKYVSKQDGFDIIFSISNQHDLEQLVSLGYTVSQAQEYLKIANCPIGMNLFAGNCGQGKTHTISHLIKLVNDNQNLKVINISKHNEKIDNAINIDFVDYDKPGHTHKMLAACMKSDPDIIVWDEVRTSEEVKRLIFTAQSGHEVFSTIHASSAMNIYLRLYDLGITDGQLRSYDVIHSLSYQRIVPILCPHCSIPAYQDKEENTYNILQDLKNIKSLYPNVDTRKIKIHNKQGCSHCDRGFIKREVCAEIINIYDLIKKYPDFTELIVQRDLLSMHAKWRKMSDNDITSDNMNGKTCWEHGMKKVLEGRLSLRHFVEAFGSIDFLS